MSQIAITPARSLGAIDRKLFGGFVEHLGHCIYGGRLEEGSALSDQRGFRNDVLGPPRALRPRAALARRQLREQLPLAGRDRPADARPRRTGARLVRARSRTGSGPTSSSGTAASSAPSPTSA